MSEWSGGYVTSVEYVTACIPEQGPIHLDLIALLNCVEPPQPRGRVSYCELGAGQGLTAALIAATNPDIDVHAIDFMPAQVARARDFAAAVGIENVTFHEASFAELVNGRGPALPMFDYVTMHGVYSWISRENQLAIVDFLGRRLNPGGLVYTSYNALPGWGPGITVQRLLAEMAGLNHGGPARQVGEAFDVMKRLFDAGAPQLTTNELARSLVTGGRSHPSYLAHEYLNQYWKPLFFADVARDYGDAKLEYVGPAKPIEMFDSLMMTEDQMALANAIPDPIVAETVRDYCRMRSFRADIHVKGLRRMSPRERDARLMAVPLALVGGPADFPYEIKLSVGVANLREAVYRPIVEALAQGGMATLGELLGSPGWPGAPPHSIVETFGMLLASRCAVAAVPVDDQAAMARARLANRHAAYRRRELETRDGVPVALPAARNAGHLPALDVVAADMINRVPGINDAALAGTLARLVAEGELQAPGDDLSPEQVEARIAAQVADRRRIWRHLGLID